MIARTNQNKNYQWNKINNQGWSAVIGSFLIIFFVHFSEWESRLQSFWLLICNRNYSHYHSRFFGSWQDYKSHHSPVWALASLKIFLHFSSYLTTIHRPLMRGLHRSSPTQSINFNFCRPLLLTTSGLHSIIFWPIHFHSLFLLEQQILILKL